MPFLNPNSLKLVCMCNVTNSSVCVLWQCGQVGTMACLWRLEDNLQCWFSSSFLTLDEISCCIGQASRPLIFQGLCFLWLSPTHRSARITNIPCAWIVWLLGSQTWASHCAVITFTHWAISLAPQCDFYCYLSGLFLTVCVCLHTHASTWIPVPEEARGELLDVGAGLKQVLPKSSLYF